MKILIITSLFPENKKDYTGDFVVDSIFATKKAGNDIAVLVTRPWVPRTLERLKPGLKKGVDYTRLPSDIPIMLCYHFSIPRYYCRWFSNRILIGQVVSNIEKIKSFFQFDLIHAHSE